MTDIFVDQVSAGANKIIWAGTSNGLNKLLFTKEGMKVLHIKNDTTSTGLKGEFISVIHQDSNSDLWIIGIDGWMNKLIDNRYNDEYPQLIVLISMKMGHSILPNHCKKMGMEIFGWEECVLYALTLN